MGAKQDYIGQRFGKLVALRYGDHQGGKRLWCFRCDCGREIQRRLSRVKAARSPCCGCSIRSSNHPSNSMGQSKHGLHATRIYRIWHGMIHRCHNEGDKRYHDYGGRGISVEWPDFTSFADWAFSNGYAENLQIDRVDNDGNYGPANCRFVTPLQNMQNTRRSRLLEFPDGTLSLAAASRRFGVHPATLSARIKSGMTPQEAATQSRPLGFANPQVKQKMRERILAKKSP